MKRTQIDKPNSIKKMERLQKALIEIKSLKVIAPKIDPPIEGLSQRQIFGIGQMNMLIRVWDILDNV